MKTIMMKDGLHCYGQLSDAI